MPVTDFENPITLSGVGMPDPKTIGTCRIEARLASSSSRLFRAVDLSLGKTVVVKLMKPPFDEDPRNIERFLAFGSALVGVASPHVVPVLHAGRDGPTPYIVLDWVDGEDLESVLKREKTLVPQAALRVALDAASGLDAAMKKGALHGDVRPRHFIRVKGEVKVTGFGLSPATQTAQGRTIAGHPAYVAPEIVAGKMADHRADIYALGCTLFELLVGRPPYGTASADALLACHLHEPFPSLKAQAPRATPELEGFLSRLVAKDPERRFATYVELLQAGATLLPKLRHLQPTQPTLLVEDGRQQGMRIDVPEGELLLGRVPGEGFALDDARVSRRHALVRRSGDYLEVEDLASRNGIRVNGIDVRSRQLFPGDRLEIGDTILRVEGPVAAVSQIPAQQPGRVIGSPMRGAFGDVEVSHPPQRQAQPQNLAEKDAGNSLERIQLLSRLAPLFAGRAGNPDSLRIDAIGLVADVLKADHRLVIKVKDNQPVFEAATAHEAQLLSGTLPALERALPGQLSLATSVRVNIDDRWSVVLAPIFQRGQTTAMAVLIRRIGRFDDVALTMLEATCSLLSLRADTG